MANYKESFSLVLEDHYTKTAKHFIATMRSVRQAIKDGFSETNDIYKGFDIAGQKLTDLNKKLQITRDAINNINKTNIDIKNTSAGRGGLSAEKEAERERKKLLKEAEKQHKQSLDYFKNKFARVTIGDMVSTAITAGFVATPIKLAIEREGSFAGVKKLLPNDFTPEQIDEVKNSITKFGRAIPISTNELFSMSQGLLGAGVGLKDLQEALKMTAEVSVAFDITARAAGIFIGKMKTMYGSLKEVGDLTDLINYLSNNNAAFASQLVEFAQRTLPAAKMVGLSKEMVLSFGTSMIAQGTEVERASTAFLGMTGMLANLSLNAKSIGELENAGVNVKNLKISMQESKTLLKAAGIDIETFKKKYKENSTDAMKSFLIAMSKIQDKAKQKILLEKLFGFGDGTLEGANVTKIFTESIDESIKRINDASDKTKTAGSRNAEYTKRIEAADKQLELFQKALVDFGVEVGTTILPAFTDMINSLTTFLHSMSDFIKEHPTFVKSIMTMAGVLLGLKLAFMAIGLVVGGAGGIITMFKHLNNVINGVTIASTVNGVELTAMAGGLSKSNSAVNMLAKSLAMLPSVIGIGITTFFVGKAVSDILNEYLDAKNTKQIQKEVAIERTDQYKISALIQHREKMKKLGYSTTTIDKNIESAIDTYEIKKRNGLVSDVSFSDVQNQIRKNNDFIRPANSTDLRLGTMQSMIGSDVNLANAMSNFQKDTGISAMQSLTGAKVNGEISININTTTSSVGVNATTDSPDIKLPINKGNLGLNMGNPN